MSQFFPTWNHMRIKQKECPTQSVTQEVANIEWKEAQRMNYDSCRSSRGEKSTKKNNCDVQVHLSSKQFQSLQLRYWITWQKDEDMKSQLSSVFVLKKRSEKSWQDQIFCLKCWHASRLPVCPEYMPAGDDFCKMKRISVSLTLSSFCLKVKLAILSLEGKIAKRRECIKGSDRTSNTERHQQKSKRLKVESRGIEWSRDEEYYIEWLRRKGTTEENTKGIEDTRFKSSFLFCLVLNWKETK